MREILLFLSWSMIIIAVIVFCLFTAGKVAEYGRHAKRGVKGLDPKLAWCIQEIPSFVIPMFFCMATTSSTGLYLNVFFVFHYFVRSFIFPHRIRPTATIVPWNVVASAFFFCTYNGFLQGAWNAYYQPNEGRKWHHIIGAILFAAGFCINQISDHMLFELRDRYGKGRHIPRGFLFERISCPNYFGEIIEWTGYAIMSWSLPALAFALFAAANLVPRARSHHAWYHREFPDYPNNRRAIFPY